MPLYRYMRRDNGSIFFSSMFPYAFNPDGSIAIRVVISGVPCTWGEGLIDGSVRRGVRGPGLQLPGTEIVEGIPGTGASAGANLPTWSPSDWEQP